VRDCETETTLKSLRIQRYARNECVNVTEAAPELLRILECVRNECVNVWQHLSYCASWNVRLMNE